jgi:hypothetical protein
MSRIFQRPDGTDYVVDNSGEPTGVPVSAADQHAPLYRPFPPAMEEWLADLRRREAAGEIRVEWSRAREPDCIHGPSYGTVQPAGWCDVCSQGREYLDWRAYWDGLGCPNE